MATLDTHAYSTEFSGLLITGSFGLGLVVLCTAGYEYNRRIRRRIWLLPPKTRRGRVHYRTGTTEDEEGDVILGPWHVKLREKINRKRKRAWHWLKVAVTKNQDIGQPEMWEMAYIYSSRCYMVGRPAPAFPSLPLGWILQVGWLPESWFLKNCGMDAALYIRFLRGCFYFTTLLLLTLFPLLFGINYTHAPADVPYDSLKRSSLSSLIQADRGKNLLWVHVLSLWLLSAAWAIVCAWVGSGTVAMRRQTVVMRAEQMVREREKDRAARERDAAAAEERAKEKKRQGWRFRTLMVSNIPDDLRSEEGMKAYFTTYLNPILDREVSKQQSRLALELTESAGGSSLPSTPIPPCTPTTPSTALPRDEEMGPSERLVARAKRRATTMSPYVKVEKVVIVKKMSELHEQVAKRRAALAELERAHIQLARSVMGAVQVAVVERAQSRRRVESGVLVRRSSTRRSLAVSEKEEDEMEKGERERKEELDVLVEKLQRFLPKGHAGSGAATANPTRSSSFQPAGRRRTSGVQLSDKPSPSSYATDSKSAPIIEEEDTLWHALRDLDPALLDRYQPLTRLKFLFVGQAVPTIDYHVTKLNLLTSMIEDLRARPDIYEPTSVAFVTFSDVRHARMARKHLQYHPHKPINCKLRVAPDTRDLDWDRLVRTSFGGDVLRGFIVHVGSWAFTLFWIIPVSLLVGLFSLENISLHLPFLAAYLDRHPTQKAAISGLLPTILVALLMMAVPHLILLTSGRGQTFVTRSKLHHAVLCRYWKFLIFDVVIAFCIGVSALTSFLDIFKGQVNINVTEIVASSFPGGAAFFVGWMFIETAVHNFLEQVMFGSLWLHIGTRRADIPRRREEKITPKAINYFYWVPNHILVVSVILIFSILNPLVIPFAFVYFTVSLAVFKNQYVHVFYRRWYEGNGRMVYLRLLRYSLDGLVVAQVVLVALFFTLKEPKLGGACIPPIILTVGYKLWMTRWYNTRMDALDTEDANVICGVIGNAEVEAQREAEEQAKPHELILQTVTAGLRFETIKSINIQGLARWPSRRVIGGRNGALAQDAESGRASPLPSKGQDIPLATASKAASRPGSARQDSSGKVRKANPFRADPTKNERKPMLHARTESSASNTDGTDDTEEQTAAAPASPTTRDRLNLKAIEAGLDDESSSRSTPSPQLPRGPSKAKLASRPSEPLRLDELKPYVRQHGDATRHPGLHWDDNPRFDTLYENPYFSEDLNCHLWLPRDPLRVIDLNDTIDWWGRALVSSEGGSGEMNGWTMVPQDLAVTRTPGGEPLELVGPPPTAEVISTEPIPTSPTSIPSVGLPAGSGSTAARMAWGRVRQRVVPTGTERIQVASTIASRAEAEDDAEDDAGGLERVRSRLSSIGRSSSNFTHAFITTPSGRRSQSHTPVAQPPLTSASSENVLSVIEPAVPIPSPAPPRRAASTSAAPTLSSLPHSVDLPGTVESPEEIVSAPATRPDEPEALVLPPSAASDDRRDRQLSISSAFSRTSVAVQPSNDLHSMVSGSHNRMGSASSRDPQRMGTAAAVSETGRRLSTATTSRPPHPSGGTMISQQAALEAEVIQEERHATYHRARDAGTRRLRAAKQAVSWWRPLVYKKDERTDQ